MASVVGKTIFSDVKGKLYFGYYKDDDGAFLVDYKTWKNLGFKDVSKGDTNKERVIKAILKNQKQFNKKVEFNMWAKQKKRTFEETMDWFIQNGWINNINRGGIKESIDVLSVNESAGCGCDDSVNEISAQYGLANVSKGETSNVDGVKVSKDMADEILNWMINSPYGKRYGSTMKKLKLSALLPIIFGSFGIEKRLPSNLKGEFKMLKDKYGKKDESVNETQFKSGDKVLISHPTMIKSFKGIVSTTLNAKGEEVLVLKGDKGVWDAKFAKLDESAILKENIQYSPTGYVKKMVNAAGKMVKDITLNGVQYRYNPAYKTYNSVKGNELLHKSHILGESVIIEGRAFINAAKKAKEEGKTEFEFNGKTYPVTIKD